MQHRYSGGNGTRIAAVVVADTLCPPWVIRLICSINPLKCTQSFSVCFKSSQAAGGAYWLPFPLWPATFVFVPYSTAPPLMLTVSKEKAYQYTEYFKCGGCEVEDLSAVFLILMCRVLEIYELPLSVHHPLWNVLSVPVSASDGVQDRGVGDLGLHWEQSGGRYSPGGAISPVAPGPLAAVSFPQCQAAEEAKLCIFPGVWWSCHRPLSGPHGGLHSGQRSQQPLGRHWSHHNAAHLEGQEDNWWWDWALGGERGLMGVLYCQVI